MHEFPNLFIPGAGKSGTTSLQWYLNQHPAIKMMEVKEPHFFSKDQQFNKGWDHYLNGYNTENFTFKYLGESSTTYFISENAIERIHTNIHRPKFIFLLRNPIDRIQSHYNWIRTIGERLKPFKEEVTADIGHPFDADHAIKNYFYKNYLEFSSYGKWLQKYFDVFGKDNCYVMLTENLDENPLVALNNCFSFLNVPALDAIIPVSENKTKEFFYTEQPRRITSIGKRLLPERLRKKITASRVLPFSTTKKIKVPAPTYYASNEERQWLHSLLSEDFFLLKKITDLDFSIWEDFN
ncbi:MAG: sulfotransferase domain-containing protein [Chitinophagaceae bacterium]|nr:sulfotransferase domain-containing protein [Chitinophagaceae bacterium]